MKIKKQKEKIESLSGTAVSTATALHRTSPKLEFIRNIIYANAKFLSYLYAYEM